jgi:acyl dehydratase
VNFFHEMMNQDGVVVATCERAALMRKRPKDTA